MPFERVLVPLDGSRLAEAALPAAEALARRLRSVLVLVHALEDDPPEEVHGEPHLASFAAAEAYLRHHRDRFLEEGLEAEAHVVGLEEADVAQAIAQLAERFGADPVVMCAHGRQTLRGRLLGPIAQRALRSGSDTIMLRTAGASADQPFEIRHILFPVDFRHDNEAAMRSLVSLASGFNASVTLLHAVDAGATGLPARMLPNTVLELSDSTSEAAREDLAALAACLREESIATDIVVSTEHPEDAIIDHARDHEADLIILVTHGRSGVAAWYERSVGQSLVGEPGLTLLLLRDLHQAD